MERPSGSTISKIWAYEWYKLKVCVKSTKEKEERFEIVTAIFSKF